MELICNFVVPPLLPREGAQGVSSHLSPRQELACKAAPNPMPNVAHSHVQRMVAPKRRRYAVKGASIMLASSGDVSTTEPKAGASSLLLEGTVKDAWNYAGCRVKLPLNNSRESILR